MKCVKCGKPATVEGFCKECYLERNPLLISHKDLVVNICFMCRKILSKGIWQKYKDIDSGVKDIVKSKLKFKSTVKDVMIGLKLPKYQVKSGIKTKGKALITLTAQIGEKKTSVSEYHEIPLTVEFTVCKTCSKKGTEYFEGVLQIRNPSSEILEFIEKALANKPEINVAKKVKLKTGVDYFLSSNKFIQIFSKKLFNRFGGELNVSKKLFTRNKQTGKNVYRTNVLIRLPDFRIGDTIRINKQLIVVTEIKGSVVYGTNLMTRKLTSADYKLKDYEIVCTKENIKKTTVSRKWPHIEIIHPETYQSVVVKNKLDVQPGQKVKVALIDGYVYLV